MHFNFETYPFEKLREHIKEVTPNPEYTPITLTIGEPKFETPEFITQAMCDTKERFREYPKTAGEPELKAAMQHFHTTRFNVTLEDDQIIPTAGTREVLFNFPQFLLFSTENPVMAFTNPFYQIYEGAAKAARAEVIHLDLLPSNHFKPQINEANLSRANLVILNFPNNPTGSVMSLEELREWVRLAIRYDFVLLNDECYSEIYYNTPPPTLLQAAIAEGVTDFKNILTINSISKRSSAPGLRSGFIAGDATLLKAYLRYRTYAGVTMGVPVQHGAIAAWRDESHVEAFRQRYYENAKLAHEILDYPLIEATFYVWLKVDDDQKAAYELLRDYNVLVLPGSFLGRNGCGKNYIRIALVETPERTRDALTRIKDYLEGVKA